MLQGWFVVAVALVCIGLLFAIAAIASYRDRLRELERRNAELADANSAAEAANLSKTRFLAAASHDILQPLSAARLYLTSLVERHGVGEDARLLIGNVDASLAAVEDILAAVLEISRLDVGTLNPDISAFRIDDVLAPLALDFAPVAQAKGIDLVFVACSLTVRSDRRLLRRLLQNLISNAIKYTRGGRVLVGCRRRGARLRIDVHDTGIGIPPHQHRAVFLEFHRLEQGAREAGGLGLGLSIVERIARVLDHPLGLVSQTGRGSHFSVEVPMAPPATRRAPAPETRLDRGRIGETVLCLDNDANILDATTALLQGWGCELLAAVDLAGAVAAMGGGARTPSGLLVDYHLEHSNGIEAIGALRRQFDPHLPAALITADRSAEVRDAARALGIAVLDKPLKPAALRATISQWAARRLAAAE
ncbi:MAG TPA: NahK/ErcS family hybrid sensor histidine kinase/response regulator [Xanthobacteraceae bacterium]|nr:NahK/ErcS family hybrid sensor histidine kinase/response regulator [Xanthobacteraceae bacterium]